MKTLFGDDGNGTTKMSIVKWNDKELKAGPGIIELDGKKETEMICANGTSSYGDEWSIIGTAEMSYKTVNGMKDFFTRAEETLCPLPYDGFVFSTDGITGVKKEDDKNYKSDEDYKACHDAIMKLKTDVMPTYDDILKLKFGENQENQEHNDGWKRAWNTWYCTLIVGLENYREGKEEYSDYFESKKIQLIKMDNFQADKNLDKNLSYPQFYRGFHSTEDYKKENGKIEASGGKMRKSRRRRRRGRSTRRRKSSRKSRRRRKA